MRAQLARIYAGDTNIDFIGKRKLWFALSGVLMVTFALLLGLRGLEFGIEFRGGVSTQAPIEDAELADASVAEIESAVRAALTPVGAQDAQVQIVTDDDGRSVLVQTEEGDPETQSEIVSSVAEAVGTDVASTDSQRIGSKWGGEITRKAFQALVVFIIVVFAFISFRFEWKMAAAAVVALVHDLMLTAGVYSLLGFEVTPSTVIAILTILGYSLYDTVVVFDKVEENIDLLAASGRVTYESGANRALNQVFMRSFNTSLSTLLPVAALLFVGSGLFGAETLEDLALALFVGLLLGSYSSIYIATPFLSLLKEREPKYRGIRERRDK
ncbi:MAG: protein translocase subunit SecF, partial [Actinomycetota bacterium]|nr:protein translocase subunit SecF [Actinomycetota bacterium]